MSELLGALEHLVIEIRQFVAAYGDASTMPGRRQSGMDADGARQVTHGPNRPTEVVALDERRLALQAELKTGAHWLAYAVAAARGVSASMDRALSRWEGEDTILYPPGGNVDHCNGAAEHG